MYAHICDTACVFEIIINCENNKKKKIYLVKLLLAKKNDFN